MNDERIQEAAEDISERFAAGEQTVRVNAVLRAHKVWPDRETRSEVANETLRVCDKRGIPLACWLNVFGVVAGVRLAEEDTIISKIPDLVQALYVTRKRLPPRQPAYHVQ